MKYAFEAAGEFDGATTSLPDGQLVNIGERLANGDGRIETNDETLANALRGSDAVKEVAPSEDAAPKPGTKAALAAELDAKGVEYPDSATKADLEQLLEAHADSADTDHDAAADDSGDHDDDGADNAGEEG